MQAREKILKLMERINSLKDNNIFYWKFNPCLTEEEITNFENKHKIKLPDEYKFFLILIGNGGSNPYCGINELSKSHPWRLYHNSSEIEKQATDTELFSKLKFKFKYLDNSKENIELYYECENDYWLDDNSLQGALVICHYGCNTHFILQVSGDKPGSIWYDTMSSNEGIYLYSSSFYNWYNDWIDNILKTQKKNQTIKILFDSCKNGNLNKIDDCLKVFPDIINFIDPDGDTPLSTAIINRNYDVVKHLIKKGVNPNSYATSCLFIFKNGCGIGGHRVLIYSLLVDKYYKNENTTNLITNYLINLSSNFNEFDKTFLEIIKHIAPNLINNNLLNQIVYKNEDIINEKLNEYNFENLKEITIKKLGLLYRSN